MLRLKVKSLKTEKVNYRNGKLGRRREKLISSPERIFGNTSQKLLSAVMTANVFVS
jgi:hypothetical protein